MTDATQTPAERGEIRQALQRLEPPHPRQVAIWRAMTGAQRLEIAFQAYQFVLDVVRLTERQRHPGLSEEELAWRVTRRMQGDPSLGRERDGTRNG